MTLKSQVLAPPALPANKAGAFRSSVGNKVLMAATGLILFAFVIGHLLGNLLIFRGPEAVNGYAQHLRDLGALLWAVRLVLLLSVAVHIWTSIHLAIENRRARPTGYRRFHPAVTSLAARTMMASGVLVAAYIVYHLLHFTFRTAQPELARLTDSSGRHDVYAMMVLGFRRWPVSLAYLGGVGLLCLHLGHGAASALQTLGLNNARTLPRFAAAGHVIAWLIFLGYAAIPLAVLGGVLTLPGPAP